MFGVMLFISPLPRTLTCKPIFEKLWENEPREKNTRTVSESSMSSFSHLAWSMKFAQVSVRGDAKTSQMFPEKAPARPSGFAIKTSS